MTCFYQVSAGNVAAYLNSSNDLAQVESVVEVVVRESTLGLPFTA